MNWRDDPDIVTSEQEHAARSKIIRSAILWTPIFAICLGAWLFFGFDRIVLDGENGSTWFLMVVLTGLTTLFAFPAIQSLLDVRGGPLERDVRVIRRWSRRDAFVVKNHFLKLESGQILEGNALSVEGIEDGDQARVRYYPHSAVIVWARRASEPPTAVE
jgi:hypothetical protein